MNYMRNGLTRVASRVLPSPIKRLLSRGRSAARAVREAGTLEQIHWLGAGRSFQERFSAPAAESQPWPPGNPLRAFFEARHEGRGIWKWEHYFDVYHRHFQQFRGRDVHVVEIGIYSGGSLEMWKEYFGSRCRIYGVDIEESCKRYEDDSVKVFVGDQADRDFWRRFRAQVPTVDIVIDDGGHEPVQQAVTLEELLPHLRPGGIYLCEDIHGSSNDFGFYLGGLIHGLNATHVISDMTNQERRLVSPASGFQSLIDSIHFYPFLTVIEKRQAPVAELVAPKHGTMWEPFLR